MLILGECLCCIAPAAAMLNKLIETTQNTNIKQLLASNYGTFRAIVVCENFISQIRPSTQLNATIGAEELVVISSYQMLSAD